MVRLFVVHVMWCMALVSDVSAQTSPALAPAQAFDVASVKPSPADASGSMISGPMPSRFTTQNATLKQLVMYGYGVRDYQVLGGPAWASSDGFDIAATYPGGKAQDPMSVSLMVRSLLRERFKLRAHTETREQPTYELVLSRQDGRLGPSLRRSDTDCEAERAARKGAPIAFGAGGVPTCMMITTARTIQGGTRTLPMLAAALSGRVDRPVIDRTGLTGNFDIVLEWTPDPGTPVMPGRSESSPSPAPAPDAVSIFTALQEQLGLRLASTRGPVEVVVIDSVERPSPD
jgi:uncharacterized protein (TIGR03435 family)